jgi:3-oxoacyl-[acyl-carrier-protein] synthase III
MGMRIDSVATARPHRVGRRHALGLSDRAVRVCLDRAGRHAGEIDLLVNAGLYRDENLAEPALASIIQEDVGANPGDPPRLDRHGTFSFDVMSGGCGILSATRLVQLFVAAGTAQIGLVVAADADPGASEGFPFPPAGGAILLSHTEADVGFSEFSFRTFPELAGLFDARVAWEPAREGSRERGSNVLEVRVAPDFARECVAHGARATSAFLDAVRVRIEDVDLLVASQYPPRFADDLARTLGVRADRIPRVKREFEGTHTAGPVAALESAVESGSFARARRILFVTAGAGLTIATALYTK